MKSSTGGLDLTTARKGAFTVDVGIVRALAGCQLMRASTGGLDLTTEGAFTVDSATAGRTFTRCQLVFSD